MKSSSNPPIPVMKAALKTLLVQQKMRVESVRILIKAYHRDPSALISALMATSPAEQKLTDVIKCIEEIQEEIKENKQVRSPSEERWMALPGSKLAEACRNLGCTKVWVDGPRRFFNHLVKHDVVFSSTMEQDQTWQVDDVSFDTRDMFNTYIWNKYMVKLTAALPGTTATTSSSEPIPLATPFQLGPRSLATTSNTGHTGLDPTFTTGPLFSPQPPVNENSLFTQQVGDSYATQSNTISSLAELPNDFFPPQGYMGVAQAQPAKSPFHVQENTHIRSEAFLPEYVVKQSILDDVARWSTHNGDVPTPFDFETTQGLH